MGLTFGSDELGRSRLVLTAEPEYIVSLKIAPPGPEDCLRSGRWLVVSMSVWSSHDIRAGEDALAVVKRHRGAIKLGLRPFDYPCEHSTWVPDASVERAVERLNLRLSEEGNRRALTISGNADASPVWVGISNGEVVRVRYGRLAADEIDAMVEEVLSAD